MNPTQVCAKCGAENPLSDFYFDSRNKRHRSSCKECDKGSARERALRRYHANIEKSRAEQRDRYARRRRDPEAVQEGREKGRARMRDWREKNPERNQENARRFYWSNREAEIERAKRWQAENAEHMRAFRRRWYRENMEESRAQSREWYHANKERSRETNRRWRKENPLRVSAKHRRRKARLRGADGDGVTVEQWAEIMARFNGACAYCGATGEMLTMDHVEPIARGGADTPENAVPACVSCNSSKGARFLLEWVVSGADRCPVQFQPRG